MRFFALLLALMLLPLSPLKAQTAASPPTPAASSPAEEKSLQEIAELRNGLVEAFNKKDVEKLLAYLHPDIIVTWQSAEVTRGREGVRAYYNRMMNGSDRIVESISASPVVEGRILHGESSISFGHMDDTFKLTSGLEFHLDSRFSAALIREDGRWLVRGFHLSGNIFKNEIQATIVRKSVMWAAIAAGACGILVGWALARMMGRKSART